MPSDPAVPAMTGGRAAGLAGLVYFGVVFAAGFVLGGLREMVLAPRVGGLAAVALEIPVMLVLSYLVASGLVRYLAVPPGGARLAMGALALVLLLLAEGGLALTLGVPVPVYLAAFLSPRGALGLTAQLAFGLMPLMLRD